MKNLILFVVFAGLLASCGPAGKQEGENGKVNVYTHRHYDTDQQLFSQFEKETGIKVNVVSASADELIQRMRLEGEDSPADVLITVDAGRLHRAKEFGLLQPVSSEQLEQTIPDHLRDRENFWFGLTYRARIIAHNPDNISADEIATYESLAEEPAKGKLLIRSSGNIYNQSLMASIVAHHGEEGALKWAEGVVENMARKPKGSDRDQVKAVAAGEGDLAVLNSYYMGKMLHSSNEEEVAAAKSVEIIFPNQNGRGTHINVSGAGVSKHAPNKENAVRFIEFLANAESQKVFAEANYEYPVNPEVSASETLQKWGDFKADTLNLTTLGELNEQSVKLLDRAGWK